GDSLQGGAMNYAFLIAGGAAAFGLVLHLMLGRTRPHLPRTGDAGDPLIGIDAAFGRHAASLVYAAMALTYAHASRAPDAADAAMTVTMLGLLLAVLRAAMAMRAGLKRLDAEEWGLMALAAALGLIGLQL